MVWTPDHSCPFQLQIDVTGVGIGAIFLQKDSLSGILYPVGYLSAKLKRHQLGYSIIEKEALALVLALQQFECYLYHSPQTIDIYMDRNPLAFL